MYFCTETKCCSGSIHRYVTTTDNGYFFTSYDWCIIIFTESFHQIISGQVFIRGKYTLCSFSRNAHEHWKTGARSDKYSFKSFFLHQLINCDGAADDYIRLNLNTQRFYIFYFFCYYIQLWKTEFRDTIYQNSTRFMKRFKDSHIVTQLCKVTGTGKSRRARTDHGYFLSVFLCSRSWFHAILSCPVSHKTFQLTDGNCFTLDTTDTFSFTLAFLWANTSTDSRKCRRFGNHFVCFFKVSFFYFMNKTRNINAYRTSLYTFCILTVQTSGSFFHCLFFIISQTYFVKIGCSDLWILFSYRNFL